MSVEQPPDTPAERKWKMGFVKGYIKNKKGKITIVKSHQRKKRSK